MKSKTPYLSQSPQTEYTPVIFMLKLLNKVVRICGRKDFFNVSSIKKLVTNNVFDISKARGILNYEPRYDLAEGLKRTYKNSYKF